MNNFVISKPYGSNIQKINFSGKIPLTKKLILPKVIIKTPTKRDPVALPGVSFDVASFVIGKANELGISIDAVLRLFINPEKYMPKVMPEPSKSVKIGNCRVTSLIDGEQIFKAYTDVAKEAKEYLLNSMFEFQNLKIDGHKWPTNGAEVVPGSKEQQEIMSIFLSKKKENNDFVVQQILDTHKWYITGNGEKKRHYNNMEMIKYMKENGIDVVPSPRGNQGGAVLDHVKVLIADGRRAVVTGMNMGSHSAANHDFGFLIETLPNAKNSEVDNLVNMFNTYLKFSWERLGSTDLMKGPLTKEDQQFYNGLNKEIKEENVEYMEIVGKLFDNSTDKKRYSEGRLNLMPCNPVENPKIKVLRTSPRELEIIGDKGEESIREEMLNNFKTAKKYRGLNFVFTDKEAVEIIIDRHKKGELDAKLIVESGILKQFPYCRKAYNLLKASGVPVRIYKSDEEITQRMHAKMNIFDRKKIVSGSFNMSAMGLNQNLDTGLRNDYELYSKKIQTEVKNLLERVKEHEELVGIPPFGERKFSYEELKKRKQIIGKAFELLADNDSVTATIDNKKYSFNKDQDSALSTIHGYYAIVQERYKAKESHKRGNNECAITFETPKIAKTLLKQFDKDWKYSKSDYDRWKDKEFPMQKLKKAS